MLFLYKIKRVFKKIIYSSLKREWIILEDNKWSLWKILDSMVKTRFVQSLKSFEVNELAIDEDCLSQGQIKSKLWLLNELKKTIFYILAHKL